MFVIPCKYNNNYPFIIGLVKDIRFYHPKDKIVIVDSDSNDKSYFDEVKKYDVIIEDSQNINWMIGAYWYVYKKYPNEEFYFFMHDSMKVKDNLDYLKEKDLTTIMYFNRNIGNFNSDPMRSISRLLSGYGRIVFNKANLIFEFNTLIVKKR